MIRSVVEAALDSKVDETLVVLGWDERKIREALAGLRCRLVVNSEYERGQSSSLKKGLKEIDPETQAVLILPGDIADIDSTAIDKVVDSYTVEGGIILVASHEGRFGHPILMDRSLFREVSEIGEETQGLKSVVKNHESEIRLIETGSDKVLKDVDTPEDLHRITS